MTASYVPGQLATLVTDEGVVVAAADRVTEVASLAGRGLEPLTVVEVLSRGDLGDLPDFAAARVVGAEVRVLVRGAFAVRVGELAVDGRDAATWTEAVAYPRSGAEVHLLPIGTTPAGPRLPLDRGVVLSGGLTWRPVLTGAPAPEPAPAAPEPAPQEAFAPAPEHTVVRVAPAPPVPPAPPTPPAPPAPTPTPPPAPVAHDPSPDHDGRTITPAQLQALRASQAVAAPAATPPPRPLVALELSSGRVVAVRRRVLIGRSPRVQQVGGSANLPALVTVDDPYVSSTHLEVSSDGIRVTVTDTSTNGTLLARPGRTPVPLDHGVATEVGIGDVLTLSKGLTAKVVPAGGDH